MVINESRNEVILLDDSYHHYIVASMHNLTSMEAKNLSFEPQTIIVGQSASKLQTFLIIGGKNGQLTIHDSDKDSFINFGSQIQHNKAVTQLLWVQDLDLIISTYEDKQILVWNLKDK